MAKSSIPLNESSNPFLEVVNSKLGGDYIRTASKITSKGVIPTGILYIDRVIHGGIPEGRITTFSGKTHGGKSTVAYCTIAEFQKKYPDKRVLLVDAEGALPDIEQGNDGGEQVSWLKNLGVDLDRVDVLKDNIASVVADVIEFISEKSTKDQPNPYGLVVIDSLAALRSAKEIEQSAGEAQYAGASVPIAKMISKFGKNLCDRDSLGQEPITMLIINQLREKINSGSFMPTYDMPGGKSPQFFSTLTLEFSPKSVNKNEASIGNGETIVTESEHVMSVRKYRSGSYAQKVAFHLQTYYDGYHPQKANFRSLNYLIRVGVEYGVIQVDRKSGAEPVFSVSGRPSLKFESVTFVKALQRDTDLIDYISSCILMIDRVRSGKLALPSDQYLRTKFVTVPEFIHREVERLGIFKPTEQSERKAVKEVLKGI